MDGSFPLKTDELGKVHALFLKRESPGSVLTIDTSGEFDDPWPHAATAES
jgi:hypothetical protein